MYFSYAVQAGDRDEVIGIPASALVLSGATITAAEAVLTHGTATLPRGGTYELGETVEVEVEFDRAMTGAGCVEYRDADAVRDLLGMGSETLYFEYVVQEGDRDEDGIGIAANALVTGGGTITAVDGTTAADLTHDALAGGHGARWTEA